MQTLLSRQVLNYDNYRFMENKFDERKKFQLSKGL